MDILTAKKRRPWRHSGHCDSELYTAPYYNKLLQEWSLGETPSNVDSHHEWKELNLCDLGCQDHLNFDFSTQENRRQTPSGEQEMANKVKGCCIQACFCKCVMALSLSRQAFLWTPCWSLEFTGNRCLLFSLIFPSWASCRMMCDNNVFCPAESNKGKSVHGNTSVHNG